MSASIVSGLMEMRNTIDQILENGGLPSSVKMNKNGKPRKESNRKGKATPHGDFTKMICEKFKDDIAKFKSENPEQKGAHLVFVSSYKKEHADEYKVFEAEWKEKQNDNSDASSADEGEISSAPEKSKRAPMSDEQKAKMKAGREAAAAKKKESAVPQVAIPAVEVAPKIEPATSETKVEPAASETKVEPAASETKIEPVTTEKAKKPVKVAKKTS